MTIPMEFSTASRDIASPLSSTVPISPPNNNNTNAAPSVAIHQYVDTFSNNKIWFQVQILGNSGIFAWIGLGEQPGDSVLECMSIGMPSVQGKTIPATSSALLSTSVDDPSPRIAERLATKFTRQVFVSCNLPTANMDMVVFAERKLMLLIKNLL